MAQGMDPSEKRRALLKQMLQKKGLKTNDNRIPRRTGDGATAPLSFSQQRLWFLDQLEPGGNAFNLSVAVRLQGSLDFTTLERSYNEVIQRHEALRTTFAMQTEQPVQMIAPALTLKISQIDLSGLEKIEHEREMQHLAKVEAERPFNLSTGPLLRAALLRLGPEEHIFVGTMHHIISDGWSGLVFIRELMTLYDAHVNQRESVLPELPIQYADFSIWQRKWLQGEILTQLAYWKSQLAGVPPVLELPTDRPRPPVLTFRGAHLMRPLSTGLLNDLQALSRREGVTLYMTLLSAFNVLLYRYTRQTDFVVGTPIANRNRAETEDVIGFFVSILAMRANLADTPTFRELLQRTRKTSLGAYAHQDLPFEMLVDAMQLQRDLSYSPVFQVMFILQNASCIIKLPGMPLERLDIESTTTQYDLILTVTENEKGVTQTIQYSTDLFDETTIARMMDHFETLLESLVADPGQRITRLALLPAAEQQQLITGWNQTESAYPEQCVHALFEAQVERRSDAVALAFGDQRLTYRELNAKANQLAHALRKLGVRPGALVGICVERSLEMVVGLLGILKAGGAYLPLDPTYPAERLAFMLGDAAPLVILTQRHLLTQLPQPLPQPLCLDSDWEQVEAESRENPVSLVAPSNLAYVLYTSGSTGAPKGVCIHHQALVNFLTSMQHEPGLSADDILLAVTTVSFDIAGLELYLPLITGAQVELVSREVASDGLQLSEKLSASGATIMQATPATWRMLLAAGWAGWPKLKVLCGGEALSPDLARDLLPRCGELWNMYGPTETTIWSTIQRVMSPDRITIGRPIANTQIYILDAHLNPQPISVPGDLYIGGDGLAFGYLNQPNLTAERFIPNPFTAGRLYKTGDLARWLPDGQLECLGRSDTQVKVRGFRIELGEIEAALAKHPDIQENVVVACDDSLTGAGKRLVAYVVSQQPLDPIELRSFLRAGLPEYMLPAAFVFLERLPLTPNGKIDRKALPAPDSSASLQGMYIAPRTATEEILADIWSQVLGVESVSAHDSFFDLGGHSLLAARMISRVRQMLNTDLPLRSLFETPRLEELAAQIESIQRAQTGLGIPLIAPAAAGIVPPLSFAQERLWFLDQLEPGNPAYNIPAVARLTGALDCAAITQSLNIVIQRHAILRTTFAMQAGQPIQVIAPVLSLTIPLTDLSGLEENEREQEAQRLMRAEASRSFDLSAGPLLRASLLRLSADDHVFLVTMHHIISDGWSSGILVQEMAALYAQETGGPQANLPALPIQYADYAAWQREWLQGQALEQRMSYWRERLAGAPAMSDLPTDFPPPAEQSFQGSRQTLRLTSEPVTMLSRVNKHYGGTLFMTLLAGLAGTLSRWTGQTDFVLGTVVANRERLETEQLIGCLINFLPLRIEWREDLSWHELLERTKSVVLDASAHQDCPFEQIVAAVNPERSLAHNPLYNVGLLFQNFSRPVAFTPRLSATFQPQKMETAQLDLRFIVEEDAEGLVLNCEYRIDLFREETIRQLLDAYAEALTQLASTPETRVGQFTLNEGLQAQAAAAREREHRWQLAVSATFTAEPIADALNFWLVELGLQAQIEFAAYNQVFQELLTPQSLLNSNTDGVNVLLVRPEDWSSLDVPTSKWIETLERNAQDLVAAVRGAVGQSATPYLVVLCPASPSALADDERRTFLARLEAGVATALGSVNGVFLLTSSQILAQYPVTEYADPHAEALGHVPYTPAGFTALGTCVMRALAALRRAPYKVLVLDCDQTLWGGVCGEDGAQGIRLDSSYLALQQFALRQREAGMLVCLSSKNVESDVQDVFAQRADMRLKWEHLAGWRLNWEPKAENLKSLAAELGLGLDSFIFIDDNPVECAAMEAACPQVLTLQLPEDTSRIPGFIDNLWVFDRLKVTADDRQRAERYTQNRDREQFRQTAYSLEQFLAGLELKVQIRELTESDLERASQLTQRTNQFNTTTRRRTAGEMGQSLQHNTLIGHVVEVSDRFGEYGLVGLMLAKVVGEALVSDTFLLSCRVLGRGVEHQMVAHLGRVAQAHHLDQVELPYIETAKNLPALNFLQSLPNAAITEQAEGRIFQLPVDAAVNLAYTPADADAAVADNADETAKPRRVENKAPASASAIQRIALELATVDAIQKKLEARLTRQNRPRQTGAWVGPRTEQETRLAEIWSQLLHVEKIGIHDNFFELGGHSLLATQVISRVRDEFQVEIPLKFIFDAPTVATFAQGIDGLQTIEIPAPLTDEPRLKEDNFPLSASQEREWFLEQFEPGTSGFVISFRLRLDGELDVDKFHQTILVIVQRHQVFRTTFKTMDDGRPVQVVADSVDIPLPVLDLQSQPETTREAQMDRHSADVSEQPFDLSNGPLVRTVLIRTAPNQHVLVVALHHIIADGWSLGILAEEFTSIYGSLVANQPITLPNLPFQYTDFARWQQNWLTGETLQEKLRYWKERFAGELPVLQLSTDQPRPAVQTYRGARQSLALPFALTQPLKALCQREGISPFMALLAAFKTLLYRYTNQDDICVGTFIANRNRRETEALIGFFVNTLALRTDLSGNPSFQELLQRVRNVTLEAYVNQDIPFEKVLAEIQPVRDPGRTSLFQVMFVLQNAPTPRLEWPCLSVTSLPMEVNHSYFDLTLSMYENENAELICNMDYNIDLFDASTITRLLENYRTLLASILEHPDWRISNLRLLSLQEKDQLLAEWNGANPALQTGQCIHELFEAQAERSPDAPALFLDGQTLSYAELNHRANQVAHYLKKSGVGLESRVGICIERSMEMIVAILGTLKAGAAYVPMDPGYPKERLSMMIADAQPAALLTQETLAGRFADEPVGPVICLDRDWAVIAQEPVTPVHTGVGLDNLAYVIYTSGSTGTPKGVLIQHGSLKNYAEFAGLEFKIESGERILQFASISFDSSAEEIYPALIRGATLVLRTETMLTTMQTFLQRCEEWRINLLDLPTAFWHELTAQMDASRLRLPERIRLVIIGGERGLAERYTTWQKLVPSTVRLLNTYGPTESTIVATLCEIEGELAREMPIGHAVAGNRAYILDKNLNLMPIGAVGELYIAGMGLARGYLGRPGVTAERFLPDPFVHLSEDAGIGARMYRTGDLARYRKGGTLEFVGRADDQVKIRGFRIELGEIETALRQMDGVHAAVVIAREDTPGDRQLVAYLVSSNGEHIQASELRTRLKERLPDYMMPAAYVWLDELPLTTSQKVNRRALPAPDRDQNDNAPTYVAPQTPLEESLAEIWADVLRVPRVGRQDNFFDLGGHSLLATQLFSRMREFYKVDLPLRSLFESPTVAGLALHIEAAQHTVQSLLASSIQPVSRHQKLPLSYAQERMWFYNQLSPGDPGYNVSFAIRINGPLNLTALERSLAEIAQRHETLRTTFTKVAGKPVQVIDLQRTMTVPIKDLRSTPEIQREAEIQRLIEAEGRWSFELAHGPLFRLSLLQLAEDPATGESEHIALVTMHHIISDGWSVAVLGREVMSLYTAFTQGDSLPSLPDLPIQYADFAHWQREWFQGNFLGGQLNYWKKQLAGELPILELPADRVRPEQLTGAGASIRFKIPVELTQSIQAISRRESATMFMLLLTAFKTLLHRYTGQEDLIVGSPIANRTRVETENLIGCFINPLALRTDFSGNPTFLEALQRVRNTALEAYAHQDLPFETLVKALKPGRELRHMPVFQMLFILHNAPIGAAQPEGLTLSSVETHNHASPFDVTMTIWATEPEIDIALEYKTDLFDDATILRMSKHFQMLLESIAANPNQTVSSLRLLPETERRTLLEAWSGSREDFPQHGCIHQLFESQVARTPNALAVIAEDQSCTYQELNQRANQLAHYLQSLGVQPEMRVGLCLERSVDMLVGLMGILKAGGAYVPLDPGYPPERLALMLGDTDPAGAGAMTVLLTQENLLENLPAHQARTVCIDRDWDAIATQSRENPSSGVMPDNLAYTIYTSGSTGNPKGVMVQHRSLVNYTQAAVKDYVLGPQDRVLQFASISFDTSIEEIYPSLTSGATLVLRTDAMLAISTFVETCQNWNLTVLNLPTAFWHEWVAQMNTGTFAMPASIRLVVIGGERAIPERVAVWHRQVASNVRLVNTYGATEATAVTTLSDLLVGKSILSEVPIGRPVDNLTVYILDQELNPVPIGIPGELHIGGIGLARGYLGHPALTAERFIPDPFSTEASTRMYQTHDLARFLPNGEIEYLGRIDHLVKIRGFRIELGEIEAILSRHPAVQDVVVMAREDASAGKRLVAYIVPQNQATPSSGELRSFLESSLPKYMIPSAYVLMESFPQTPTRKLDRRALPAPDFGRPAIESIYVAPRNEIERKISSIWQDALRIEKVGIYDNFFDLGGHSLLIVQVHSQLQESLETEISIIDLFKYPTIDTLASYLSQAQEPQQVFQASQERAQKQRDATQKQRERMQERRKQTRGNDADEGELL